MSGPSAPIEQAENAPEWTTDPNDVSDLPYRAPWGQVYDLYLDAWLDAWELHTDQEETRREWRRLLDEADVVGR
ncbi:hypothetical protein GA0070611_5438 [Micromonospora auratinigra]|uniref:Uncharacterized protein n=1 Tax=Micromonospora auratinigra TaxID=261654 RepID=A0A1A9A686_9ACTN|nr:hypothetical protein GA0070611_5438 [Micromonospora auratinigra]